MAYRSERWVIMIRPNSSGAPYAVVPGDFATQGAAEDAVKRIVGHKADLSFVIVPTFL